MLEAAATPAAPATSADKAIAAHQARQDLFAAQSAHANRLKLDNLARAHPAVRELLTQLDSLTKAGAALAEALGKSKETITALEADKASVAASIGTYQAEAKTAAEALASLRTQLASTESRIATLQADVKAAAEGHAAANVELEKVRAENVANLALLDTANAELVKVRADLAAALKKAKPAGGQ